MTNPFISKIVRVEANCAEENALFEEDHQRALVLLKGNRIRFAPHHLAERAFAQHDATLVLAEQFLLKYPRSQDQFRLPFLNESIWSECGSRSGLPERQTLLGFDRAQIVR